MDTLKIFTDVEESANILANLLRGCGQKPIIALTGAGISTSAGLKVKWSFFHHILH
jgi:hypothetical protein